MDRFRQIDDLLVGEQLNEIQLFFQNQVLWKFGWQSDRDRTPFGHWNHDFLKTRRTNQADYEHVLRDGADLAPLNDLWLRLKSEHLPEHTLVRCYANAHTFGVEGYPHSDSRKPGNHTVVIYLNPTWRADWAGETVFFNDAGDIFQAVLPKPGRTAQDLQGQRSSGGTSSITRLGAQKNDAFNSSQAGCMANARGRCAQPGVVRE